MDNTLSSFLFSNITEDKALQENFQMLLYDYANSLFCKSEIEFNDNYKLLLNYADLLSLSENQGLQNLSQQIVILISQLFANNDEVNLVKESVYKNVSILCFI